MSVQHASLFPTAQELEAQRLIYEKGEGRDIELGTRLYHASQGLIASFSRTQDEITVAVAIERTIAIHAEHRSLLEKAAVLSLVKHARLITDLNEQTKIYVGLANCDIRDAQFDAVVQLNVLKAREDLPQQAREKIENFKQRSQTEVREEPLVSNVQLKQLAPFAATVQRLTINYNEKHDDQAGEFLLKSAKELLEDCEYTEDLEVAVTAAMAVAVHAAPESDLERKAVLFLLGNAGKIGNLTQEIEIYGALTTSPYPVISLGAQGQLDALKVRPDLRGPERERIRLIQQRCQNGPLHSLKA